MAIAIRSIRGFLKKPRILFCVSGTVIPETINLLRYFGFALRFCRIRLHAVFIEQT